MEPPTDEAIVALQEKVERLRSYRTDLDDLAPALDDLLRVRAKVRDYRESWQEAIRKIEEQEAALVREKAEVARLTAECRADHSPTRLRNLQATCDRLVGVEMELGLAQGALAREKARADYLHTGNAGDDDTRLHARRDGPAGAGQGPLPGPARARQEGQTMNDPTPMLLWCPDCGSRHIDQGEFAAKPHHTHACQHCGMAWRPAIIPTVGVHFLPGFRDEDEVDRLTKAVEDLWLEFVHPKQLCGLCGNSGWINTLGNVRSAAGVDCGVKRHCTCPNGRTLKAHGCRHE